MFNQTFNETLHYFFFLIFQLMLLFVAITFIVGLILQYINPAKVEKILSRTHRGTGNMLGAGLGALTPFCSCTTIPILVGLLNGGAPFGASMSFLIASPVLNPFIVGLLLSLFGWKMTLIYAVVLFSAAVLVGMAWESMGLASEVKIGIKKECSSCCAAGSEVPAGPATLGVKLTNALYEALNLFKQVLPFILIGALVGAIIRGYVPADFIVRVAGPQNPAAIPVASVIGVPMYIRAATMIPISAVLLEKGMGLGAVVALIIGGAGASLPEITLLGAIFKRKLVITFIVTVFLMATMAGFLFSALHVWLG